MGTHIYNHYYSQLNDIHIWRGKGSSLPRPDLNQNMARTLGLFLMLVVTNSQDYLSNTVNKHYDQYIITMDNEPEQHYLIEAETDHLKTLGSKTKKQKAKRKRSKVRRKQKAKMNPGTRTESEKLELEILENTQADNKNVKRKKSKK